MSPFSEKQWAEHFRQRAAAAEAALEALHAAEPSRAENAKLRGRVAELEARLQLTFTTEQLEAGARAIIEERNGVPLEQIDTNAMERAAILANAIADLEVALEAMQR